MTQKYQHPVCENSRGVRLLILNSDPPFTAEEREEAHLCAKPYAASRNH